MSEIEKWSPGEDFTGLELGPATLGSMFVVVFFSCLAMARGNSPLGKRDIDTLMCLPPSCPLFLSPPPPYFFLFLQKTCALMQRMVP